MHHRRAVRRSLSLAVALAVVLAGTGAGPAAAEPAATDPHLPGRLPAADAVRLLTGDRLLVETGPDGHRAVTVDPAPRTDAPVSFQQYEVDDQVYVIPSDAAPLIPDVLDRELFNVTKLADYGYTDTTPVILRYEGTRGHPAFGRGVRADGHRDPSQRRRGSGHRRR